MATAGRAEVMLRFALTSIAVPWPRITVRTVQSDGRSAASIAPQVPVRTARRPADRDPSGVVAAVGSVAGPRVRSARHHRVIA